MSGPYTGLYEHMLAKLSDGSAERPQDVITCDLADPRPQGTMPDAGSTAQTTVGSLSR